MFLFKIKVESSLCISQQQLKVGRLCAAGERGIIYGIREPIKDSHVFNVIKIKGELELIDGQHGIYAQIRHQGYIKFQYLKVF